MQSERWTAPFTPRQVEELTAWQMGTLPNPIHPYTCRNDSGHHLLVPTTSAWGWICPDCDYTQAWAHAVHYVPIASGDGWIQTFTGRRFYPLAPNPNDIDILDIAHALSMLCRFGGHVHDFYSVAEHCVLMSEVVSPENALWALMHDAAEAYIVDVPRPVKRQLVGYRDIERHLLTAIAMRFGLTADFDGSLYPTEVADVDTRILLNERNILMPNTVHEWEVEHLKPLHLVIHSWTPQQAKAAFLATFKDLVLP